MTETDAAQALLTWMEANQLTQVQLAARLGVSRSHLSMVLNRKRTPSLAFAGAIERITGIPVQTFIPKESL